MNDQNIQDIPSIHEQILKKCEEIGFTMPSDLYIGTLLKTLISSKPNGRFLELGTGIGLSLSWMVDGLKGESTLISIDNDPDLIAIAEDFFSHHPQVEIFCEDGGKWIENNKDEKFDLIFADAWPGKYTHLEEALTMINPGGFYVIDDMNPQPNWPDGHQEKAEKLVAYLESRNDFVLTKMNWSTGIIIATKV